MMQESYIPFGGTPLIPPSYLTAYFLIYIVLLTGLYIYFYKKRRPTLPWQKVKLLVVIAALLKISLLTGIGILAAYWLVPTPGIRRVTPIVGSSSHSPVDKIEIVFDRPVSRNLMVKSITPDVPGVWVFENSVYTTHLYRNLVFYPTYSLRPNTKYTINLSEVRNMLNVSKPYNYQFEFTTQASPNITAVYPATGQEEVDIDEKIKIKLDNPNDNISEFDFQFTPKIDYDYSLDTTRMEYTVTPKSDFIPGTQYNLKVVKSDIILNVEDKTVVERSNGSLIYDGNFTTKKDDSPSIISRIFSRDYVEAVVITPENGWSAVSVNSQIKVVFDQDVNKSSAETLFSISPEVDGDFSWEDKTLIFTPKNHLDFATSYVVTVAKGVKALDGVDSNTEFKSEFTTQNDTVKLEVPAYLQKYTLSCEIASLRMALNFRGLNTTEDEIIPKVGTDPTQHKGNVWGDPNKAFVGNIRGTQMENGYGVHWAPIARVAREYRNAEDFTGWNIEQLTKTISDGNPVVIWVYSHFGTKTVWFTPDGTKIDAVRDEHAVTAVGFVGPANNPTQLIINDPLIGQVYWSRATFDKKWGIFNNSGVVVY